MSKINLLNILAALPYWVNRFFWPRRFVLYGHLISDQKDCVAAQRYRYPTFREFEEFRVLAEKLNYHFVTVEQYYKGAFPRMILLTFDDGFYEVLEFYRRTKLYFILFIVSGVIDNPNFGLNLFAPKSKTFLSYEEVKELKNNGIHIGFHTRTHKKIMGLEDIDDEVEPPALIEELISTPKFFAYPFEGPVNYVPVSAALINLGYEFVFDTKFRTGFHGKHIFRIPMDRSHADKVDNPIIANILQASLSKLKRIFC